MLDEGFPQGFNATSEIVELTQPPEVRKLLIAEIAQMKDEAKAMDNLSIHGFIGLGAAFGPLTGVLISLSSGGNAYIGGGVGFSVGITGGALVEALVDKGYNYAINKIKDVRQQNFSKRVWSALPADKQQIIKASMPQVRK